MPTLIVNGSERRYDGNPDMPLLWYLRDEDQVEKVLLRVTSGFVRQAVAEAKRQLVQ
jgi:aerobic-type carbon monoxide dehydrogenase small subunit (CoxS/CutS family)